MLKSLQKITLKILRNLAKQYLYYFLKPYCFTLSHLKCPSYNHKVLNILSVPDSLKQQDVYLQQK